MSLYVRHCAWLNAVPEEPSKPDSAKKKPVTRREALKKEMKMAEIDELEMPPCDAQHLVGYFFEMGPTMAAGMVDAPLSHSEIDAWQRNTGIELDAWEARTIRRMSRDYVNEAHRASERDCPSPWADASYAKPTASLIEERIRQATRELAKL